MGIRSGFCWKIGTFFKEFKKEKLKISGRIPNAFNASALPELRVQSSLKAIGSQGKGSRPKDGHSVKNRVFQDLEGSDC